MFGFQPVTRNLKPKTQNPKPKTQNPKPKTDEIKKEDERSVATPLHKLAVDGPIKK